MSAAFFLPVGPIHWRQAAFRRSSSRCLEIARKKLEGGAAAIYGQRRPPSYSPTLGFVSSSVIAYRLEEYSLPKVLETKLNEPRTARTIQSPEPV